jgi:hypothetical protein
LAGPTGAQDHRSVNQPVRDAFRQGIEDDPKRGRIGDVAMALTIAKFGLDAQIPGFGENVHSLRHLHPTAQAAVNSSDLGIG